ncbi:hypothetical protein [Methylobacterium sp. E-045]|uniref:hypothetical protein n=1 Tax=Methylobacterium sp. E-045 TaxID=2836575 RepID=UPI001FB8EEA1|nr:hypothetical protein [Methylobacterium sp. E-045]MCJ2132300.1 hypothetical protein [Methylobacterium sp. E-045]
MPSNDNNESTRRESRGYRPMSLEAWGARIAFLRQALAKVQNPELPDPDLGLLTIDPHGPLTSIWVAAAPNNGPPAIFFRTRNLKIKPRSGPPEIFLMMELLIAFGGGLSVNDNGRGLAYVRLWGGNERHDLGRLIVDARRGQLALQDKQVDHREQYFQPADGNDRPKLPHRMPRRDREDAIKTALGYWDRNHRRAEFKVSRAEYEAIIRDSFRLVDAYRRLERCPTDLNRLGFRERRRCDSMPGFPGGEPNALSPVSRSA